MGLFARFTCLRHDGTAMGFAPMVRDLLQARNVVETLDPAATERLLMIAPAGDGWVMVFDHVERPGEALSDNDGLLRELSCSPGRTALDIIVGDSDDLILLLIDGGELQSQLEIGRRGLKSGALEVWQRLLLPGKSVEDIRRAFATRVTFVEEYFPVLKPLFGIDLTAFKEVDRMLNGSSSHGDTVLLRLKAVPAPGQTVGPPKLEIDERQRQNFIVNRSYPQIPLGLVTNFPPFSFQSRGGGARGLHVKLNGSALHGGMIEIVASNLVRRHPTDRNLNLDVEAVPEITPACVVLRFGKVEVPDWVQQDQLIPRRLASLHDLSVFVYARGIKVGEGELTAEAHLVEPKSASIETSYPVIILPAMWRPLKGSDQPHMIHYVRALNQPARVNCLAVLRAGRDESVAALRRSLEVWRSLVVQDGVFTVRAATEPVAEGAAHRPADLGKNFELDLSKARQAEWDRLMADLPSVEGLSISNGYSGGRSSSPDEIRQRHAARIGFHYTSAAPHPRLPEWAARLGHVSLSFPAKRAAELALGSLMQSLASEGMIGQAYIALWDHEDEPKNTLYESAADSINGQRVAGGHATCVPSLIACGSDPSLPQCCRIARLWNASPSLARLETR
jgi:hypothetical protein